MDNGWLYERFYVFMRAFGWAERRMGSCREDGIKLYPKNNILRTSCLMAEAILLLYAQSTALSKFTGRWDT